MSLASENVYRRFVLLLRLAVLTCFLEVLLPRINAQEAALKERFLAEALPKRDEYERFARRLQGTATMRVEFLHKDGKKEPIVTRFEFKQNSRCASIQVESESPTKKEKSLSAVNPDYSFMLKGADASASWVVTTIEAPDSTLERRHPLPEETVAQIMPQYYFEHGTSLADLLQSPGFLVERAEEVLRGGRTLARITFRLQQEKTPLDPDFIFVQGGVMLLDPDHHWCPLERTSNCIWTNGSGPVKERFEYTEGKGGFYILKRRSYIYKLIPNGSKDSDEYWVPEWTLEYDLHDPWRLPSDSEFRLPAYGLPEPPQWRRQTPWYLWALGGGTICLVVGFLIHRRIRRIG